MYRYLIQNERFPLNHKNSVPIFSSSLAEGLRSTLHQGGSFREAEWIVKPLASEDAIFYEITLILCNKVVLFIY